jgi:hypothetical protein
VRKVNHPRRLPALILVLVAVVTACSVFTPPASAAPPPEGEVSAALVELEARTFACVREANHAWQCEAGSGPSVDPPQPPSIKLGVRLQSDPSELRLMKITGTADQSDATNPSPDAVIGFAAETLTAIAPDAARAPLKAWLVDHATVGGSASFPGASVSVETTQQLLTVIITATN